MVRKLFMTLVAVLLISSSAFSQTGKITGRVIDRETGDALPGANVIVVGSTIGAATNVNGEFVILSVPTGVYDVKAGFIGYREVTIDQVHVNSGLTTQMDFELPSEALEVSEISIVAERPLVNKNATNAVRIRAYEDIKNLPLRGVGAAVALQPGIVSVNNQIFIRGGRANSTGFFLEGASVQDRMGDAATSLGGNNPVNVIPEALEEFQVQAGGFNAEFGGASAGIVRQTLKSGGQDYHGTFQFETDDLAGDPGKTFLSTPSFGYRDFTATLGGPVPGFNNKLRFFVAGERRLMDDRIQRFNRGFNFQHSDTPDFANNRFPLILEENRDPGLEAIIQQKGLVMNSNNVPNASREEWIGNGTLVYDAKPFIFRLGGSASWRRQDEVIGDVTEMLFNDRVEQQEVSTALLNFKVTHLLSSKSFYEVNLNYFDRREFRYDPVFKNNFYGLWDSVASSAKGIDFFSLNNLWRGGTKNMQIYGFDFEAPNSPANSATTKRKRNYVGGTFNFTTQLPQHEVKFGASYERWTARNFQYSALGARNALTGAKTNPDNFRRAVAGDLNAQRAYAVTVGSSARLTYGYDVFGNEIDRGGVDGAHNPQYFSAYLQDKFEANDIVINAGVRLDVIDNDDFTFVDPSNPPWDRKNRGLFEDQIVEEGADVEFSPRVGIAFPVTDRTVFHMQYGRFVQAPRLTDIYNGSTWYDAVFTGGSSFQTNVTGFGLKPEITTQYEMGFNQQFSDNAAFDITTFYKNIKDQIQLRRAIADATSPAGDYNILQNGDFSTTAGVETSLTLRRTSRMAAQVNYTFSRALGTGSVPSSAIAAVELLQELPTVVSPLNFHRAQTGSFNLDYRWARGDGGPILEQLGANFLFTFRSGHPYTLAEGDLGQQDESLGGQITDPRSRRPLENINASTTPWNFQLDFRLDKTVSVGKFNTNFYLYVQNLTNKKNVINVFNRTGNAFNDGFLDDSALSASVIQARSNQAVQNGLDATTGARAYEALYRAINLGGNAFNFRDDASPSGRLEVLGIPRQFRLGARIEL